MGGPDEAGARSDPSLLRVRVRFAYRAVVVPSGERTCDARFPQSEDSADDRRVCEGVEIP